MLPEHHGPTAVVPAAMDEVGLEERDGIEAKTAVIEQLRAALALVGVHDRTDPTLPAIADQCGLTVFAPHTLRTSSSALLTWLASTGATTVAIHVDVDTIDANEIQLGLGADRGGLTSSEAHRVVTDLDAATDVVAVTIA